MPAGELRFGIIVDDRGTVTIQKFGRVAKGVDKEVKQSGKRRSKETADAWGKAHREMTGGWKKWKTVALGALAAVGAYKLVGWAKKIATGFMDVAVQAETLKLRLETLLGSTDEANKLFENLRDIASEVPYTFMDISESATMLSGVLKGGREEIMQYMPMILDLAAATGVGITETTGQFMRMVSAGIGACDLWREKGVKSMLGFKEGVQYSQEESVKIFINAWTRADSLFRGATDKLKSSWSGMVSMFQDVWDEFRLAVMDADVFKALKKSAGELLDKIKILKEEGRLDEWARDMAEGTLEAMQLLIRGIGFVAKAILSLKALWRLSKQGWADMEEKVYSGLAKFEEKLIGLAEWHAKWFPLPFLSKIIKGLKDGVAELEGISEIYGDMGDEFAGAVDESSSAIDKLDKGVGIIIKTIQGLKTETDEAAEAQDNFNKSMGGVKETAGYIQRGLEGLCSVYPDVDRFAEAWKKIEAVFTRPKIYIQRGLEGLCGTFVDRFEEAGRKIEEVLVLRGPSAFEIFADTFKEMVATIISGFGHILMRAESFGGAMKDLFGFLRETIFTDFMGGMAEAFKTGFGEAKDKGGGFLARLKGGFGGIGEFLGGNWIGGIMTAVTTFMPMLVGLFHKPEWKKVGEEVARDLGVGISEELSKKIAETAKEIGDRYAAISVHIADVMREVGLTTENFETFGRRAHDILSHFQAGVIDSATATESLDNAFSELVKGAEDMGITFSRSMIDIIRHSRELGLEVKSISEFIDKKLNASIGGLNKMIKGMANSQDEFNRVARVTLAIFNEIIASGGSYLDAVSQIKECLDELAGKQEEWGLEGTEAYDKLKKFANLVEVNKDLVESVQGMTDAYSALGSIGALTEELFADWQSQALAKYDQLIAAGFSENEALRMLAPTLNALAEAAKTYTYNISDSMQGLYDAADAQNLLKETNPFERMNNSLDRMVTILEKLAKHWGVMIDDLETYRGNLEDLPTPPGYEGERGRGEGMQFGTPYVPYTGFYKLHNGEAVIPAEQNRQQSMQMGAVGGQVLNLQVVVPVTVLDEELTPRLFRRIYDGSKKGEVKIHAIAVEKG